MGKTTLSNNIKNLLHKKGKSQTDMAKELNLNESTVSSWVNGAKYPGRDSTKAITIVFTAFEVPFGSLKLVCIK